MAATATATATAIVDDVFATPSPKPASTPSKPLNIRSAGMRLDTPAAPRFHGHVKAASTSVGLMSPVNQNGCFEFDRIIKAGTVVKRTRKTKVRPSPVLHLL